VLKNRLGSIYEDRRARIDLKLISVFFSLLLELPQVHSYLPWKEGVVKTDSEALVKIEKQEYT
jgi:hypothetical protein